MTNEAIAQAAIPRRYSVVALDLQAARDCRQRWLDLAVSFVNRSFAPILVVDGEVLPRDVMKDVPDELRRALSVETTRVLLLEYELRAAYEAERAHV